LRLGDSQARVTSIVFIYTRRVTEFTLCCFTCLFVPQTIVFSVKYSATFTTLCLLCIPKFVIESIDVSLQGKWWLETITTHLTYISLCIGKCGPMVFSETSKKVGHSDLVMVRDTMMYYHTKFGGPASNSIKDMLWTKFSVKNLETKWPPVRHLCLLVKKLNVHNLPAIFEQCAKCQWNISIQLCRIFVHI